MRLKKTHISSFLTIRLLWTKIYLILIPVPELNFLLCSKKTIYCDDTRMEKNNVDFGKTN